MVQLFGPVLLESQTACPAVPIKKSVNLLWPPSPEVESGLRKGRAGPSPRNPDWAVCRAPGGVADAGLPLQGPGELGATARGLEFRRGGRGGDQLPRSRLR